MTVVQKGGIMIHTNLSGAFLTRTLFELLRRTSESARAYCTNLSRRLRDGVSLLRFYFSDNKLGGNAMSTMSCDGSLTTSIDQP